MPTDFHDILFPIDIALGSKGGPERKTDVITLGSGREQRNARWAHSRRRYDAGYGVKNINALQTIITFFEERRGRLYGFRWHDRLDASSCAPTQTPAASDQVIGIGDGLRTTFQLTKTYGSTLAPYVRAITKPVTGSVKIAVAGVEKTVGTHFTVDHLTGMITFLSGHIPALGTSITAGYRFDAPVRFDTDMLDVDLSAFDAGAIPKIPLVEVVE